MGTQIFLCFTPDKPCLIVFSKKQGIREIGDELCNRWWVVLLGFQAKDGRFIQNDVNPPESSWLSGHGGRTIFRIGLVSHEICPKMCWNLYFHAITKIRHILGHISGLTRPIPKIVRPPCPLSQELSGGSTPSWMIRPSLAWKPSKNTHRRLQSSSPISPISSCTLFCTIHDAAGRSVMWQRGAPCKCVMCL